MSEPRKAKAEGTENGTQATPTNGAVAQGTPAPVPAEQNKPGVFKRIGLWCKKHKEALITGGISFAAGAATTAGAGYLMNKQAERRAAEAYVPVQQPEYDQNSLDPNV